MLSNTYVAVILHFLKVLFFFMIMWEGNGYSIQLTKSKHIRLSATSRKLSVTSQETPIYQLPILPVFMSHCSEYETYFVNPIRAAGMRKGEFVTTEIECTCFKASAALLVVYKKQAYEQYNTESTNILITSFFIPKAP